MVGHFLPAILGFLLAVPAATPLAPGDTHQRELKAGETHRYQIELREGEYFHAVVEQRGAELRATLKGPDGAVVFVADGPIAADNGPEHVALVAAASGLHELTLEASGRSLPPAMYALSVEAVRAPTAEDLLLAKTARATNEGCRVLEGEKPNAAKSLELLREALAGWQALGDRRMQMWVENHLGYVSGNYFNRLEDAGAFYEQGLATARQLGDDYGEAALGVNLAENQRKRGLLEPARENLERARALHRAAGRTFREARVLLVLGAIDNVSGDLQQALDHLREALERYEQAGDAFGRGSARMNIGNSYLRMGEFELAIESYQAAVQDLTGRDRASLAYLAAQIGDAHLQLGDRTRARAGYQDSLAAYQALGNHVREARALMKLGILDREEGNLGPAREALSGATSVLHDAGDPLGEAIAWCELGETQRQLGDLVAARAALDQATRLSPEWHVALTLCREQGLARLSRDGGDLAAARRHAERAVETVESLRASVESQRSRGATLASGQSVYDLLIDVRMRQHAADPGAGHDAAALEVSERARARSLLELLADSQLDVRSGPPALIAEEHALRQRLNALAQAQEDAASARRDDRAEALGREIAGLSARLAEIDTKLRHESPGYAALARPQPLSLADIRQVLGADTVLLEYALGDSQGYVWVVSAEGLATQRLAAREVIERAARRLHQAASPATAPAEREAAWSTAAEELGRLVLPPDLGRLAAKRLLVVAPGALQYVPFAALPVPAAGGGAAAPVLSRFEVVNAPSASVVATLRQERAEAPQPTKALAVFADPVFAADDPRVHAAGRRAEGKVLSASRGPSEPLTRALKSASPAGAESLLTRLPFSRQEAEAILAGAPHRGSLRALGFDASRDRAVSAALADYRIVHFATHGLLNTRQPELSGMVLSLVDREGRRQDGFLRLHDIYHLRLRAELVVLSGCQTALGKDMRGEGLQGLTRGFMYAGAPRVVASLWQVDDLATAELMKRFYRAMFAQKLSPAAALRAAQQELAATRQWHAPYYWAAFGLHGDWR